MALIEGFDQVPVGRSGWSYTQGEFKIVLHTTESNAGTIRGVESWYRQRVALGKPLHPQLTIDASTQQRHQHIDTHKACYALKNDPGGVQTNAARAINIEMVGRAAETPNWPAAWFEWIGAAVIAPIVRAHPGIDPARVPASGFPSSGISYGTRTRWRMGAVEWRDFTGVCGHVHVPEGNAHSDPGAIAIDLIVRAALTELGRPHPKEEPPVDVVTTPLPAGVIPDDRLTTASPGLNVDERTRRVQELLGEVARSTGLGGIAPGAEDGLYGPATQRSVRMFRELAGMDPWFGEWDQLVAAAMRHWLAVRPVGAKDRAPALVSDIDAVTSRYR